MDSWADSCKNAEWLWFGSSSLEQVYEDMWNICDVLRDLAPFVQFKNCEKTHGGVLLLVKLQALLKVTLLHGCFSRFFKLYKWHQIEQRITFCQVFPLCYLCSMHKIIHYPKMTTISKTWF